MDAKRYAVVFDLDGTLSQSKTSLLKHVDHSLPPAALRELVMMRDLYFTKANNGTLPQELQIRWIEESVRIYVDHGLRLPDAHKMIRNVLVRQGVAECLMRLSKMGVKVAVVSFGIRQFILHWLAHHGLGRYVSAVFAIDLVVEPATDRILGHRPGTAVVPDNKGLWSERFADSLGVPYANLLAVGDTRGDKYLGHLRENRLGIVSDEEEAALFKRHADEAIISEHFDPVTEWLLRKMG